MYAMRTNDSLNLLIVSILNVYYLIYNIYLSKSWLAYKANWKK